MGTSTRNSGQKGSTPLVPSWLDEPEDDGDSQGEEKKDNAPTIPPSADSDRFRQARGDFTRYVNSGGRDTSSARRSISRYVSQSLDGSKNATQRLGSSRVTSARLFDIASKYSSGGAHAVEQYLSLSGLANKPASEVFATITDLICPDGGLQDEGIARDAYLSAIEDSPELADTKFGDLTSEQFFIIVERTMANAVVNRIINDIGNKVINLPTDCSSAERLVAQVKEFIFGAISDAANKEHIRDSISQRESLNVIDRVYERAFNIMSNGGGE